MKLILEDIISNSDFNSLWDDFRNLWLDTSTINPYKFFSNEKNLFDYQEKALENAIIALSMFFNDFKEHSYDELKERHYNVFIDVLWEDEIKELDIISKNHKDRDSLEILEEYFDVEQDERIVDEIWLKGLI